MFLCLLLEAVKGGEMKCERKSLDFFFLFFDLSFLTLEFFFNSFVCTLENTNSLSN